MIPSLDKHWPGVIAGVIAACGASSSSRAQCGHWESPFPRPGFSSSVNAVTTWDADGPGPLDARLIAGGAFATNGGETLNGIAAWNGAAWQPLGTGVGGGVPACEIQLGDVNQDGGLDVFDIGPFVDCLFGACQ